MAETRGFALLCADAISAFDSPTSHLTLAPLFSAATISVSAGCERQPHRRPANNRWPHGALMGLSSGGAGRESTSASHSTWLASRSFRAITTRATCCCYPNCYPLPGFRLAIPLTPNESDSTGQFINEIRRRAVKFCGKQFRLPRE